MVSDGHSYVLGEIFFIHEMNSVPAALETCHRADVLLSAGVFDMDSDVLHSRVLLPWAPKLPTGDADSGSSPPR